MAMVLEKTSPPLKPKTTTSTFLGCFRLRSGNKNENDNENKVIKSRSCFCLPRFGVKKAAATKTVVPLDVSAEAKSNKQGKFEIPAATEGGESPCVPVLEPLIVSSAKQKQRPLQTESTETDQAASDTINRTEGNNSDAQKRRLSFRRKVESIRTPAAGSSQPGSPVPPVQHHHHQETNKSSSPSATPLPKRRRGSLQLASSARNSWLVTSNETTMTTKRLDPLVGMTIIMVTLIIMLLWGRLCAILCTAAWFYLLPSLTQNTNLTSISPTAARDDYLDFSSDEYKKKVILEGLLERNTHRTHHLL